MTLVRYCVAVALLVALGNSYALASGFQLNEHGTKAMAMGGAFVAQASDGSAMFFNPAGLAFQQGFHALVGVTPIMPSTNFSSATIAETKMVKQTFFLPHAYISYGLANGLAFGAAFYAPYGLGTEWPSTWGGRYLAVKTDLKTYYINPTIAIRITDDVAIGVGFSYVKSNVKLSRKIQLALPTTPPTLLPDGNIDLDGDGHGYEFDAGILVKATEKISFGASYRHSNKIDYEGTATFSNMGALASFFPGGVGKTTITIPNNIFAGVAYQVTPEFLLEADMQYVVWSKYDTLKIDIPIGPLGPARRPLQGPSAAPKNWHDSFLMRLGGQYQFEKVALRAGFIYDQTPQPDKTLEPMLPDANRYEATIGLGYELTKGLTVDVAYQFILFQNRTAYVPINPFPGTYKNTANLFGLSLGYGL